MTHARNTEFDLLEATARTLEEQGYDVVRSPAPSLLPEPLRSLRLHGVAIGRTPKLVIEVAQEGPENAKRVAVLQEALKEIPDWKLHLVVGFTTTPPEFSLVDEADIANTVDRASQLASTEAQAALLMAWAALEALARARTPSDFRRPQSPGRIVERLASDGTITPSEAAFMRSMAAKRNSFIHGDLSQLVSKSDVERFLDVLRGFLQATAA